MKKLYVVSFCSAILILIQGCEKVVNYDAERMAVKTVLDNYIVSIENEDLELYAKIMFHDPDMVNFGTAVSDIIIGWDDLKKVIEAQNAALSETKITQSNVIINITGNGQDALATTLWDFRAKIGEQTLQLPVRCTWVLEKYQNEWKIIHFHKSVGV